MATHSFTDGDSVRIECRHRQYTYAGRLWVEPDPSGINLVTGCPLCTEGVHDEPIVVTIAEAASRMAVQARHITEAMDREALAPDAVELDEQQRAQLTSDLRQIRIGAVKIETLLRLADSPYG